MPAGRLVPFVVVVMAIATTLDAQFPPDSFTNLRVLPKTISRQDLMATMRGFSTSLGANCTHCHVGDSTTPLNQIKFADDAKATKEKARAMLQLVSVINERLADLPSKGTPSVQVTCQTCHRGLTRPVPIEDELRAVLASSDGRAAAARYRALRAEYADRGAYDFSESTLNAFALGVARTRKYADAITLLQLSAELHPKSGAPFFFMGEVHRASADTASAIRALREALRLDPSLAPAKRALDLLTPKPGSV